ncbi:hypothetical protein AKO1_014028 [Acrasis kona]|uniref:F-box domain-containing protein n=1 Tax=Acrasis kona TaxID=1008807 RepID=A0AAW2Z319_9EUKA
MVEYKDLPTEIIESIHSFLNTFDALSLEATSSQHKKLTNRINEKKRRYQWYYQHIFKVPLHSDKMNKLLSYTDAPNVNFHVWDTSGDEEFLKIETIESTVDYVFNDRLSMWEEIVQDMYYTFNPNVEKCVHCSERAIEHYDMCINHVINSAKKSLSFRVNFIYKYYSELGIGGNHCSEAEFDMSPIKQIINGVHLIDLLVALNSGEHFEVYLGEDTEEAQVEPKKKKRRRRA